MMPNLVEFALFVALSCFCQALQNISTQTKPTHVQERAEGNGFNSDPLLHSLSGRCNFTFRMQVNSSSEDVALTSGSVGQLVEHICQELGCGAVHRVREEASLPGVSCFQSCEFGGGRLRNCSRSKGGNCTVVSEALCGHQMARLSGGTDQCSGRVEVWRAGQWGTVCDDQWDLRDADVLCGQLGCGFAVSVTGQGGAFPPGTGPVHLDELNCTGQEENLWECLATRNQSDCGHKEDAGVVCSEMKAVRLSGGLDRCSGKVEIHRNGSWGSVCDNCWNKNMASMVCSMLGCGVEPVQVSQFVPPLTHNPNGTLWYYSCNGNENNLWQCREIANKLHLCKDSKASGVVCNGSLGFPNLTKAATDAPVITETTTEVSSSYESESFPLPSIDLLASIAVSLVLLVFLVMNTVLCCLYRRRHAFLLQQSRSGSRPSSENHHNNHQDAVNLTKVTTRDTDDSQRFKADENNLMKPSALDSLFEEGPEQEVVGVFIGTPFDGPAAQYARVSKVTEDSFDTSSTSSGECYQNTNGFQDGYVEVSPETDPGPGQSSSVIHNLPRLIREMEKQQSSDDEDEGPIYSPVSPDPISESDDDYDDIGC